MMGVIGIATALIVLGLSLFVTRLATIALTLTGLSEETARFQARSAFTGTGFTTSESESVVDHPVRRRIIMLLMVVRSAGFVTIIISLILSFGGSLSRLEQVVRLLALVFGVAGLLLVSRVPVVNRVISRAIERWLRRWGKLEQRDYEALLRLSKDYTVTEMLVQEDDWLAGKPFSECRLPSEGVTVLGIIRKDGGYVGVPRGDTAAYPGDALVLYGRGKALDELDRRRRGMSGDAAHQESTLEHEEELARQEREEEERERERQRQEEAEKGDKEKEKEKD